jgi:outer membrane murein-binding lipoprotein Lpp
MNIQQKSKIGLICLAALVVATLIIAGCLGSAPGPVTATNEKQNEHPAAGTTVATRTTALPAPMKTAQPTPAPGLSTAGIAIDPIGDKKTGEHFLLTATTSLPVGTNLIWQILPDTGTPPAGLDKDSMMSIVGNNLVTKGDGATNRIAQNVDLGRLVPGKYVVIVGEMKGGLSDFEIGSRYGYTYFTLK